MKISFSRRQSFRGESEEKNAADRWGDHRESMKWKTSSSDLLTVLSRLGASDVFAYTIGCQEELTQQTRQITGGVRWRTPIFTHPSRTWRSAQRPIKVRRPLWRDFHQVRVPTLWKSNSSNASLQHSPSGQWTPHTLLFSSWGSQPYFWTQTSVIIISMK